jgi:hypothetical protein
MHYKLVPRDIFTRNDEGRNIEDLPKDLMELLQKNKGVYIETRLVVDKLLGQKFESIQSIEKELEKYENIYSPAKLFIDNNSVIAEAKPESHGNSKLRVVVGYIIEASD